LGLNRLAGLNCTPHGIGLSWSSRHPDSSSTTAEAFTTTVHFPSLWSESTVGESLLTSGSDRTWGWLGELFLDQCLDGLEISVSLNHQSLQGFSVFIVCGDLTSDDSSILSRNGVSQCVFSVCDGLDFLPKNHFLSFPCRVIVLNRLSKSSED